MACRRLFPPVLLAAALAALSVISSTGVAEAWWWDSLFPDHDDDEHRPPAFSSIVTPKLYGDMFPHKDDAACPAHNFYNYTPLARAAERFPAFGAEGDAATRRREVAAFLAQISHETTGGWATAPGGPFAWGLCFKEEINPPSNYCDATSTQWPCVAGKSYHGRGPIQLSWNFNYGPAGQALGFDGLGDPELVAGDPGVAFQTALWFWMTPRPPKPSCHDVMVGRYYPSADDVAANRTAGFGLTTNIINGGVECGPAGAPQAVADRIGFFKRYCAMLGVDTGPNLDCAQQKPY
ncbi:hypothetical protein U9M48_041849 [Paspalum notatum var. saurae]|uniref:chitinase n=1 Tax=Paspalum notatum var. saurae TaxID=547442 RepID=A0AAQ3UPZ7_PASNO